MALSAQQRKVLALLADAPEGLIPFVIADRLFVRTATHSVTKLLAAGLIVQPEAGAECYITDSGREALNPTRETP